MFSWYYQFSVDIGDLFSCILQGYFTGTGTFIWLYQSLRCNSGRIKSIPNHNKSQQTMDLGIILDMYCKDHSVHAASQWDTLYCNVVSHWLVTCTGWPLYFIYLDIWLWVYFAIHISKIYIYVVLSEQDFLMFMVWFQYIEPRQGHFIDFDTGEIIGYHKGTMCMKTCHQRHKELLVWDIKFIVTSICSKVSQLLYKIVVCDSDVFEGSEELKYSTHFPWCFEPSFGEPKLGLKIRLGFRGILSEGLIDPLKLENYWLLMC